VTEQRPEQYLVSAHCGSRLGVHIVGVNLGKHTHGGGVVEGLNDEAADDSLDGAGVAGDSPQEIECNGGAVPELSRSADRDTMSDAIRGHVWACATGPYRHLCLIPGQDEERPDPSRRSSGQHFGDGIGRAIHADLLGDPHHDSQTNAQK
jgi:hypothetical protein